MTALPSADLPLGGDLLDRAAALRSDARALAELVRSGPAALLPVRGASVACVADPPSLALLPVTALPSTSVLLGTDPQSRVILAAAHQDGDEAPPGTRWCPLREVAVLLPPGQAGLAAHAVGVLQWHATAAFCGVCGAPTVIELAGHGRRCTALACGRQHHPRTDACVIVLAEDMAGRCLLGRRAGWPPQRFSLVAGFVEPGESLEAAVEREVLEETAVAVDQARYVASQPWPFPASLMLGFVARATAITGRATDGELVETAWFSRVDLDTAVASGRLILPPAASIARALIDAWRLGRI